MVQSRRPGTGTSNPPRSILLGPSSSVLRRGTSDRVQVYHVDIKCKYCYEGQPSPASASSGWACSLLVVRGRLQSPGLGDHNPLRGGAGRTEPVDLLARKRSRSAKMKMGMQRRAAGVEGTEKERRGDGGERVPEWTTAERHPGAQSPGAGCELGGRAVGARSWDTRPRRARSSRWNGKSGNYAGHDADWTTRTPSKCQSGEEKPGLFLFVFVCSELPSVPRPHQTSSCLT